MMTESLHQKLSPTRQSRYGDGAWQGDPVMVNVAFDPLKALPDEIVRRYTRRLSACGHAQAGWRIEDVFKELKDVLGFDQYLSAVALRGRIRCEASRPSSTSGAWLSSPTPTCNQ
jgi:hypothetical protein